MEFAPFYAIGADALAPSRFVDGGAVAGMLIVPDPMIRLSSMHEADVLGVNEITLAELEVEIENGIRSVA
jgi:hypothetical protein